MQTESTSITYTPLQATEADRPPMLRLTLEPEYVGKRSNLATLSDIDAMLAMARSGLTARRRQVERCKWAQWDESGDLIVTVSLWVWPSDIDLAYSLTLPPSVTSTAPVLVSEPKNTKYWVSGSGGEIELPWLLENASFGWHPNIGVWDEWSRPTAPPRIEQDRARLNLDGERGVYGVLTVQGTAVGWRHDLSIRYPTGEAKRANRDDEAPDLSVSGAEEFDVTAIWLDEEGKRRSETATMRIPDCVAALLEECPDGSAKGGGSIRVKPARPETGAVTVYYNTCNGAVLQIRRGK